MTGDGDRGARAGGLTRARVFALCVGCGLLLAYLSFIPFHYRALSFNEALRQFTRLPYLDLHADSRADWVANIGMYLPLGWLLARLLRPAPRGPLDLAPLAAAFLVGTAWAVAVEFAQLYFPNRTVSLNDLIAEAIGTFAGAALWLSLGQRWSGWWREILRGGERTARAALAGYAIAYLALNFAPYDFIVSWRELTEHVASPLVGIWLAGADCGRIPCSLRLGFEALLIAPLGLTWMARRVHAGSVGVAAVIGLLLGLVLEAAQLLLVSGVCQGASVLARAGGFALGAAVHAQRARLSAIDLRRLARPLVLLAALPYLAAVTIVNGWWSERWIDLAAAWSRLGEVQWLPFYYQYFAPEQDTIRSAITHALLYAPVGAAIWLWTHRRARGAAAAAAAVAIAAVAEFGKLFVPGRHPDLTDLLIAAAAAGVVAELLHALTRAPSAVAAARHEPERAIARGGAHLDAGSGSVGDSALALRVIGAAALVVAVASLLDFPVARVALLASLALYAALLVRMRLAYLWIVPLALPMLDLAPISGRLFWDEFDVLLLVTLGVRLLVDPTPSRDRPRYPRVSLRLLLAAVAASTAIALVPPPAWDANAFVSLLSPYNALRLAKGYAWGAALACLVAKDTARYEQVGSRLVQGLALALFAVAASIVWERARFVGVFAFDVDFRVAGPIAAMNVGGAYVDAVLLLLYPFALLLALCAASNAQRMAWALVAALGFYAIVVTFSRATLIGWAASMAVFSLLWARRSRACASTTAAPGIGPRRAFVAASSAALLAVLAALAGTTLRERFATVADDTSVRVAHWRTVAAMPPADLMHAAFGLGLGAFPRMFYLQQAGAARTSAYRFESDPGVGKTALVLHGGSGLYFVQRIDAPRGQDVEIAVVARAQGEAARLSIALCEETVMYSERCASGEIAPGQRAGGARLTLRVPAAAGVIDSARPLWLSLQNAADGTAIRIDSVSLRTASGAELLRNGDFAHGADHWFFTSDDHLAWHAKNAPLQILFEMGLFGLIAWTAVAIALARRLALANPRQPYVSAVAAAIVGLAILAAVDSVIDAPRLVVLVLLMISFPLDDRASAARRPSGATCARPAG